MDDKTLNGLSASLTLLQIQLKTALVLLHAQQPDPRTVRRLRCSALVP